MGRILATSLGALALVLLAASPAEAHAQLVDTDPARGTVLDDAPETITLTFSEPVEASFGAMRVYDGSAERLDVGAPRHPDGDRSRVRVDLPELDDGSYVATWRVVSADSHPVRGAFTFQVGPDATANVGPLAERLLAEQDGDDVVGFVYGVDRFLVFASIAVLIGGLAFVVLLAPATPTSPIARRLLWGAWAVCAASTVVGIGLQGAYAAGLGLADAARPSIVSEVLGTQFGQVSVARLVLLAILAVLLRTLLRDARVSDGPIPLWWPPVTTLAAVALAATPGLGGHATSGDHVRLAVVADTVHVLAMSLWLGGLVFLVAVVLPGRDAAGAQGVVTRFSRLALACVVTLVATGAFQSWRQVASLDALRDTDYGRLLIVKIVLVAVMIVVAAFSREAVFRLYHRESPEQLDARVARPVPSGGALDLDESLPERSDESASDERRELRRLRGSVLVEVGFAVAVLTVTAMLVNTPPARAELEGPYTTVVETEDLRFDVWVVPGSTGQNEVHLDVSTRGGGPTDPLEVTVTAEYLAEDIAPIDVPVQRLGPGHYLAPGFNMPIVGEWALEISALMSDVEEVRVDVPVTIR